MHTFHCSEPWFSSSLILKPRRKETEKKLFQKLICSSDLKKMRFKNALNKQNPAMLCKTQHNIVDSTAWVRVTFVQAVHEGFSNTLLLSTFCGHGTVQLRMSCFQTQAEVVRVSAVTNLLWTMQSPRCNVCTPCVGMARNRPWDRQNFQ